MELYISLNQDEIRERIPYTMKTGFFNPKQQPRTNNPGLIE